MARPVIHHHHYARQYDELKGRYPRLQDVQVAIDWAVATDPEQFPNATNTPTSGYRILLTDPIPSADSPTPGFRVLFRINDDHSIELLAIGEDPDGEE